MLSSHNDAWGEGTRSRLVISVKEARKLLNKDLSNMLSDDDLVVVIGMMSYLSESLLVSVSVPHNAENEV